MELTKGFPVMGSYREVPGVTSRRPAGSVERDAEKLAGSDPLRSLTFG